MIYYLLIILGIATRFLPHPANFTAVGAAAIYYVQDKKMAFIIPFVIMLFSDWFFGFYQPAIMFSVYICFGLMVYSGILIKSKKWLYSVSTSIIGAIAFFIITNYAVWQFGNWYPHTISGLSTCFIVAIPFFKGTLFGNLFYTSVLFGTAEFAKYLAKRYFRFQNSANKI